MGCDIHPYFETRQADQTWKLTFEARPSEWWWETVAEKKIEDGSAITIFGPPSEEQLGEARAQRRAALANTTIRSWGQDSRPLSEEEIEQRLGDISDTDLAEGILYEKITEYLKGLSQDTIVDQYGHLSDFDWNFYPERVCRQLGNFTFPDIRNRDYEWFAAVNLEAVSHRGYNTAAFEARGVPDDCCREIAREIKRWRGDGHSHSWLMCSEILAQKSLAHFVHYQWITNFIPDPDNTRMVFFFDN